MLSPEELQFYARQIQLPQLGQNAQLRLKQARVLCIGAGGLGAPLLRYLAGAGVGTLGIVDFDAVSVSNLHRQVLYDMNDLGQNKAFVAARKLQAANPFITIHTYTTAFDYEFGLTIAKDYDVIIDGSDNFAARYAANQVAITLNKVFIFAAVQDFQGQASLLQPKTGPCFRCLFPVPPPPEFTANCAENGILGTTPGLFGLIEAHLAILYLSGLYQGQCNELLSLNLLDFHLQKNFLSKNSHCPACSPHGSQQEIMAFLNGLKQSCDLDGLSPKALSKILQEAHDSVVLIDVRQPEEHALTNIGGRLIPLATLPQALESLSKNKPIIVYCQKGIRSQRARDFLKEHGFDVQHLSGGMDAWQQEFA